MSLCKFLELDLIALRQKGFKKWCRSFFFIIFALFNPIVCVILFFYYSLFVILSHPHVFFHLFLIIFRHFIPSHVCFPFFLFFFVILSYRMCFFPFFLLFFFVILSHRKCFSFSLIFFFVILSYRKCLSFFLLFPFRLRVGYALEVNEEN